MISDQKVIRRSTFKIIPAEKRQKKRVTNVMKTRRGVSAAVIPPAAARCHSKTREKMPSSLLHKSVKNRNNTETDIKVGLNSPFIFEKHVFV